jgi:hypothetical protein
MRLQNHLKVASVIIYLLYNQFSIGNKKVGLYPVLAAYPGVGDLISIFLSIYLLWIASQLNLPRGKRLQMYGNIGFDLFIGAIPIVGDVVDTIFRAHVKNLQILKDYASENLIEGEVISPHHTAISS